MPVGKGRRFVRVEQVALCASNFDIDADDLNREAYGSCSFRSNTTSGPVATGCPGGSESADGTTLVLGWQNDRLSADIGISPLGLEEQNILGGVVYSSKIRRTEWSLSASRRPMNNSLLSYARGQGPSHRGQLGRGHRHRRDPRPEPRPGRRRWHLGYHLLRGDNSRFRAMDG